MPAVNSKQEKEKLVLTDKKAAHKWIVDSKDNPPHTVVAPKVKELELWKKLTKETTKKVQQKEKEDK